MTSSTLEQATATYYIDQLANWSKISTRRLLEYVSKGKVQALNFYWEVPADVVEDRETLCIWAERAYQVALKDGKKQRGSSNADL